jgi:hypothetical protein
VRAFGVADGVLRFDDADDDDDEELDTKTEADAESVDEEDDEKGANAGDCLTEEGASDGDDEIEKDGDDLTKFGWFAYPALNSDENVVEGVGDDETDS